MVNAMTSGRIALGFGGNPNEPSAMRGGPMFELLFGLDTLLRRQGKRDRIELTFFNAAAEPGKRLGEKAVSGLLAEMAKRRIDTHLGHKPLSFSERGVDTEGGHINADLILFMPGLTGPAWAPESGLKLSPGGFFQADEFCRVAGADKVFVAGDAGSFPGPDWMPKQAHMADLQARAAVENLLLALDGKPAKARFKVELICIVDTIDQGILVYRDLKRSILLPSSRLFHWAKRYFEGHYLRIFRK
jgi:sulfide:quinone oxidoreductase